MIPNFGYALYTLILEISQGVKHSYTVIISYFHTQTRKH